MGKLLLLATLFLMSCSHDAKDVNKYTIIETKPAGNYYPMFNEQYICFNQSYQKWNLSDDIDFCQRRETFEGASEVCRQFRKFYLEFQDTTQLHITITKEK